MKRLIYILTLLIVTLATASVQGQSFPVSAEKNNEVIIYPNPAVDEIQIEIKNSTLSSPTIQVYSIIGNIHQVTVTRTDHNRYKVQLTGLPSGYYLVMIKENEFKKTYKFLKS